MSLLSSEGGVCLNAIGREHLSEWKVDQKANEFFELNKGFNLSHFELLHHQQNVLPGKPACLSKVCGWQRGLCLLTLHFKGTSSVRADDQGWGGKINVYFARPQGPFC